MPKIKLTQKKLFIGVVVGVLIIVAGAMIWMKPLPSEVDEKTTDLPVVDEVVTEARSKIAEGNISDGMALFDSQIATEERSEEKVTLLLYKAEFARKEGMYEEAEAAIRRADALIPDQLTTFLEYAKTYEAMGDNQRAIEYYEKALKAPNRDGATRRYDFMWEQKIKELRS